VPALRRLPASEHRCVQARRVLDTPPLRARGGAR